MDLFYKNNIFISCEKKRTAFENIIFLYNILDLLTPMSIQRLKNLNDNFIFFKLHLFRALLLIVAYIFIYIYIIMHKTLFTNRRWHHLSLWQRRQLETLKLMMRVVVKFFQKSIIELMKYAKFPSINNALCLHLTRLSVFHCPTNVYA